MYNMFQTSSQKPSFLRFKKGIKGSDQIDIKKKKCIVIGSTKVLHWYLKSFLLYSQVYKNLC